MDQSFPSQQAKLCGLVPQGCSVPAAVFTLLGLWWILPPRKGGLLCQPGACLPSGLKTPPECSSQTSQTEDVPEETEGVCSGSLPAHTFTSLFPDMANSAGESGNKGHQP